MLGCTQQDTQMTTCKDCALWDINDPDLKLGKDEALCLWVSTEVYPASVNAWHRPSTFLMGPKDGKGCLLFKKRNDKCDTMT